MGALWRKAQNDVPQVSTFCYLNLPSRLTVHISAAGLDLVRNAWFEECVDRRVRTFVNLSLEFM